MERNSLANSWLFPGYDTLPMEIILHIFRYLDHGDLQAAGATCSRWRQALHEPEYHSHTVMRISKLCLADHSPQASDILKSDRPFRNVIFEEVTFANCDQLLKHIGRHATDITFDNADVTDKHFYAMMRAFPRMRSLTISRCSTLFMSGAFLDNNDDRMLVDPIFARVKSLSLRYNPYLSDAILLRLTALVEGIHTLDLTGCHVAYHNAIHRRFYPNDTTVSPSESILTFKFLMRVLALHRPYLRELNLSDTMISGQSLITLCELEDSGLHLFRLRLAKCRQLNATGLKHFLPTQPQLVVLDLNNAGCLNDDCIATIVTGTPLLEELLIAGSPLITNEGATLLGTLKRLRYLDISRCDCIGTPGVKQGIASAVNHRLAALIMTHSKVCEEGIKIIAQNLCELRTLDLSHSGNNVTDEAVQAILCNLIWLRELHLEECFRVTDAALTGINLSKLEIRPPSTSSLENFHPASTSSLAEQESLTASSQSMKISLRSRAEEEIVRDSRRKQAMLVAYELRLVGDCDVEGHSIKQLRGLRKLNLKGCNKISDVSLKYGLKFNELRSLSLSNCQQISALGMETLVVNCPSIEELDLSDCYNINDKAIQFVTMKLSRLRALHISGCTQLTDHSLDAILVNCKCLKTLSVYRCRRMYTDIEERLSVLATLRNLNMDNNTNIENAEIFRVKKRLDY